MNKLNFIFTKIIATLGVLIFALLSFISIFETTYLNYGVLDTKYNNIAILLLVCVVIFVLLIGMCFLEDKTLSCFSMIIKIGIALIFAAMCSFFILKSNFYTTCDSAVCYVTAKFLYEKNSDWLSISIDYFKAYPQLFFLVEIYSLIFKIARSSDIKIIQAIQCMVAIGGVFSGCSLCSKLQGKRNSLVAFILIAFYIPYWLYSFYIYGDIWGIALLLIGLNVYYKAMEYVETSTVKAYIFGTVAAFLLAITFNFRIILLVALIAISIVSVMKLMQKKKVVYIIIPLITIILTMILKSMSIAYAQKYTDQKLGEGVSVWLYLAMGMNNGENSNLNGTGYYNGFNYNTFTENDSDIRAANIIAKEQIKSTLESYRGKTSEFVFFLYKKVIHQWNVPDDLAFNSITSYGRGDRWIDRVYDWYLSLDIYVYLSIYKSMCSVLTLVYFIKLLTDKKETEPYIVLPGLILVGGFMASLIWEANARYILPYSVLSCITASQGLYYCKIKIMKGVDKLKVKKEKNISNIAG